MDRYFLEAFAGTMETITESAIVMSALKELAGAGLYGYIAIGCSILLSVAIDFFYSFWASPDLIIQDTLSYSVSDLGRMTSINIPMPEADSSRTLYTTPGGICHAFFLQFNR